MLQPLDNAEKASLQWVPDFSRFMEKEREIQIAVTLKRTEMMPARYRPVTPKGYDKVKSVGTKGCPMRQDGEPCGLDT